MFKEGNIIVSQSKEKRDTAIMAKVKEAQEQHSDLKVISFNQRLLDKGKQGAIEFFLDVEENFTNRASAHKRTGPVLVILNNSKDLFELLAGHYRSLVIGFISTAYHLPQYDVEFVMVSEEDVPLHEMLNVAN